MNDHCKPFACATRHAFASSPVRRPRWKFSALAAALVACAGLHAPQALALTLGPVTVQSALGEPLRAEIDLAQITPSEAESLRASTAAADVFRTQGMEYSAIASQMRVQLHRRPDGRMVLRLSGNSPVNEPFVDLVPAGVRARSRAATPCCLTRPPHGARQPLWPQPQPRCWPLSNPGLLLWPPAGQQLQQQAMQTMPAMRSPPRLAVPAAQPRQYATGRRPRRAMRPPCRSGRAIRQAALPGPAVRRACRWTRCWWRWCAPTPTPLCRAM